MPAVPHPASSVLESAWPTTADEHIRATAIEGILCASSLRQDELDDVITEVRALVHRWQRSPIQGEAQHRVITVVTDIVDVLDRHRDGARQPRPR